MIRFSRLSFRLEQCGFACAVLSLLIFTLVAGCGASGSGRTVVPIAMDPSALVAPADSAQLTTHDAAVRGIAGILVNELRLPMPDRVTVYVYASRQVFEQGLIQDAHVSPVRVLDEALLEHLS